jgi:ribokinase
MAANSSAAKIVVLGNINQDFVMKAERMPQPGETVLGADLRFVAGGKAANQAVTAARLGAEVTIIGRVGDDVFGPSLLENLAREGIDTTHVVTDAEAASGAAFIALAPSGENSIVSVPGANFCVSPEQVRAAAAAIAEADFALVQFAVPLVAVEELIAVAVEVGTRVQIDPTPVRERLPHNFSEAFAAVPNETEVAAITGASVDDVAGAAEAAGQLRDIGLNIGVVKLGANGCVLQTDEGSWHVPGFEVEVVDTTGSGDAFAAGFAVALAEGRTPTDAACFANACGALAATVFGAQPSLPRREAVAALLGEAAEVRRLEG